MLTGEKRQEDTDKWTIETHLDLQTHARTDVQLATQGILNAWTERITVCVWMEVLRISSGHLSPPPLPLLASRALSRRHWRWSQQQRMRSDNLHKGEEAAEGERENTKLPFSLLATLFVVFYENSLD